MSQKNWTLKSATTVANRGKPKNIRFIVANSHVGRARPHYLNGLDHMSITRSAATSSKTTDAGPGVSVSNFEVCFLEMLKLHEYNHQSMFNRNHQAPGDSAQNKAERANASIRIGSDTLVNGMALKWEYFKSFDDQLTDEEMIQK